MAPFCIAVETFYGKKGSDETKSGKTKKWKWSERLVMKPFARIERSTWSSSLSLIFVCNFAYESNRNMLHKASLNALRMLSDKSRSCPNKTWQRIQHTEQSEFADCICRGPHGGKPNMPLRGNWQWRPGTVRWLRKDRTRPKDKTLMWDVFWTVLLEESMFTWFYCICIEKDTYYSLSLLYVRVLSGRYRMAKKVTSLRTLCKLLLWPKKLATWPVHSEQLRHPTWSFNSSFKQKIRSCRRAEGTSSPKCLLVSLSECMSDLRSQKPSKPLTLWLLACSSSFSHSFPAKTMGTWRSPMLVILFGRNFVNLEQVHKAQDACQIHHWKLRPSNLEI